MKFIAIFTLALPALALAAPKPVSDVDWVSEHHEGHHKHKYHEPPTPTYNPYPTQSVSYGGYKRSQKVKKDVLPEEESYGGYPPPAYSPSPPAYSATLPTYPTQSVSYKPYKRFAKRNAIPQPEPVADSQPVTEANANAGAAGEMEVLTA
ncbi:MAG: hypothetical protein M1828_001869 [Chrysothrix sp. TS-e1954]|nr:MAG: hypothetical protein M1828_001869 [Chrysothrix sp. TS-e1954]